MQSGKVHIHVLTAGFASPNGQAFLMPLIMHRRTLLDEGFDIRIFSRREPELTDCDILLLDSKYHDPQWARESDAVLEDIAELTQRVGCLIYMDILDSASWDHARAIEHVTLYCKAQLRTPLSAYLKPLYGYRCFSDFYHTVFGVEDEQPVYSEPVREPALLDKLTLSWNSGLADYSWLGPYRMKAYQHFPWKQLLQYGNSYCSPEADRPRTMSCRIGMKYHRKSIAFQREEVAKLLKDNLDIGKVSRRRYLQEMQQSKIVISPFGLGEITLRDFEAFMAGAVLLKPDMSGLKTWPDFYEDGQTIATHKWDLSDLEETISDILDNHGRYIEIARVGQARYRRFTAGSEAGQLFAVHFRQIVGKAQRMARDSLAKQ